MKTTLSTYLIAYALIQDENANWSRSGAKALAEYFEQYEKECEIELELDLVAIRCDYSEFESLQEWASDYGADMGEAPEDEDEINEEIREYILHRGQLIEFDGGIIVSSF